MVIWGGGGGIVGIEYHSGFQGGVGISVHVQIVYRSVVDRCGSGSECSDPDWHQNDADPHADPTPCFTHVEKLFCLLLVTALPIYNVLSFSSLYSVKDVIILSFFEQHIEILLKKV